MPVSRAWNLRKREEKVLKQSGWKGVLSACSFVGICAAGDTRVRGKATESSDLCWDAKPQVLRQVQRRQSTLAGPGGLWAARPGSPNTKPPRPTLTSQLVGLLLDQGKDGLIQGGWRLLLNRLFLFLPPICRKGLRQASAACFPGVWPCLFQHLGFPGELPSEHWAAWPRDDLWSCLRWS